MTNTQTTEEIAARFVEPGDRIWNNDHVAGCDNGPRVKRIRVNTKEIGGVPSTSIIFIFGPGHSLAVGPDTPIAVS